MPKVLIIEDDQQMRNLYQRAFSFAGHQVSTAEDGVIGLEQVKKDKPDLILLDIMMPNKNGLQVLQELKSNSKNKNLPVVMLTNIASGTLKCAKEAVKSGALDYIIKSDHEPQEIVEKVNSILENRRGKKPN